jgi:hypothetical protein
MGRLPTSQVWRYKVSPQFKGIHLRRDPGGFPGLTGLPGELFSEDIFLCVHPLMYCEHSVATLQVDPEKTHTGSYLGSSM